MTDKKYLQMSHKRHIGDLHVRMKAHKGYTQITPADNTKHVLKCKIVLIIKDMRKIKLACLDAEKHVMKHV